MDDNTLACWTTALALVKDVHAHHGDPSHAIVQPRENHSGIVGALLGMLVAEARRTCAARDITFDEWVQEHLATITTLEGK